LRQLGKRLIAYYAPQLLNYDQRRKFEGFVRNKWMAQEGEVSWTTVDKVQVQLNELSEENVDTDFLNNLRRFYDLRLSKFGLKFSN